MEFGVRGSGAPRGSVSTDHRCPQCREFALVLQKRHVSPPGLGEPLVTEYYDCDYCDAHYQYSPASNRWKPLA